MLLFVFAFFVLKILPIILWTCGNCWNGSHVIYRLIHTLYVFQISHVVFVLCSQPVATGSVGLIFTFYLHCDFDLVATGEVAVIDDVGKDELSEHFLTVIVTDCTHLDAFSSERASVV